MYLFSKHDPDDTLIMQGLHAGGTERRIYEGKFFERYYYLIRQGVVQYHLEEEDAASIYSDTIINVIEHILTGRFEKRSSLKSYTYRIFMNKCVDLVRKKTTNKYAVYQTSTMDDLLMILPDKARTIIEELIDRHDRAFLLLKLSETGDKCRKLLLLFEDGYSDQEISGMMGFKSADVVKTSRLRCLKKLREKFTAHI